MGALVLILPAGTQIFLTLIPLCFPSWSWEANESLRGFLSHSRITASTLSYLSSAQTYSHPQQPQAGDNITVRRLCTFGHRLLCVNQWISWVFSSFKVWMCSWKVWRKIYEHSRIWTKHLRSELWAYGGDHTLVSEQLQNWCRKLSFPCFLENFSYVFSLLS